MEQYLAFRKAQVAKQDHLIEKALHATNPVEAKSILNSLRKDEDQEWLQSRAAIALEGLRAKFTQNYWPSLTTYLAT